MPPGMTAGSLVAALARGARPAAPAAAAEGAAPKRGEHLYGQYCVACHGDERQRASAAEADRRRAAARPGQQTGLGPSLRGVGALAADFYLRTGYMPLPHSAMQPRRTTSSSPSGRSGRSSPTSPRSATGPPIPTPHPERGNLARASTSSPSTARAATRSSAQGGYVTGARRRRRSRTPRRQIAEAVRIGPYVMPRFSRSAISRPRARLDHRLRRVREAPGRPRRLAHRPPRPGAGGARHLVHRRRRPRSSSAW